MTKTEAKQKAQDILLDRMGLAMYALSEELLYQEITQEEFDLTAQALNQQADRVLKLFGYEPGMHWS